MARYSISEMLRMRPSDIQVPKRRQLVESSGYSSVRSFNSISEAQPIHWHLRRRQASSSSDYQQPRSAPSGIAAQQVENFKRFYRAVVSPSHVRVTAGGRIVPNTRAIAPPQPIFECKSELDLSFDRPPSLPLTILPPCDTRVKPNRSALVTMAPWDLEENEKSRALDPSNPPKMEVATIGDSGNLTGPIQISHPSQFDNSKPFVYNGHIVYPAPAGFQPPQRLPVPFTVLGNTNFLAQQQFPSPGFFPAQLPVQYGGLMNSIILPPANLHPALQPLENLPPAAPSIQAPAILSVAELTKYQIQAFHTHLKYLDNQIANNRHQIDELYMKHQRNEVVSAIARMEAMLVDQLAHEGNARNGILPAQKNSPGTNRNILSGSASSLPQTKSPHGTSVVSQPLFVKPQSVRVHIKAAYGSEDKLEGIKAAEAARIAKHAAAVKSEPLAKSRLSAASAKAPAFQPRAMNAAANPNIALSAGSTPTEAQNAIDRHLSSQTLANGAYQRSTTAISPYGHSTIPKPNEACAQNPPQAYIPSFQRPRTFHGLPTALANVPMTPGNAIPYLVGTLPRGITAREASPKDIVYGRELTEAELRARQVYWGKRPVISGSGLPKFDGKDFYPPSPTKTQARMVSTQENADTYYDHSTTAAIPIDLENLFVGPSSTGSRVTSLERSSTVPINLENLFTASSNAGSRVASPERLSTVPSQFEHIFTVPYAGSRVPSPVRSRPGLENILTTLQDFQSDQRGTFTATANQIFCDNTIIGYKSPSPRPSSYRYEASCERYWPGAPASPLNYAPITSPSATGNVAAVPVDDFSHIFLERGEPGFRSPTPPYLVSVESRFTGNSLGSAPVTPTNRVASLHYAGSDTASDGSDSVVFTLSPKMAQSTSVRNEASFAERAANISSADQKLLHNMLKHTAATVSAPALSSATAQGYLPQYSGFAAASLSQPSNSPAGEVAPLIAANFLPENRPLNRDRPRVPIRPSPETMGAEAYMRHLAAKAEEDARIVAQGWDSNTTATGPVTGSDW